MEARAFNGGKERLFGDTLGPDKKHLFKGTVGHCDMFQYPSAITWPHSQELEIGTEMLYIAQVQVPVPLTAAHPLFQALFNSSLADADEAETDTDSKCVSCAYS